MSKGAKLVLICCRPHGLPSNVVVQINNNKFQLIVIIVVYL